MVATGQEIVREKKILQGQGKVREFHFESGKIYIFEKSQGKVKFFLCFHCFLTFQILWYISRT